MKTLKAYWKQASRPMKIFLTLLLLAAAGMSTYIALGSPPLTPMMGFRQAEKASMVGPSQILETFTLTPPRTATLRETHRYDETVIVAQTQDLDILYNYTHNTFYSYPKSQRPTLYCASGTLPTASLTKGQNETPIHLILFDRNDQAVRAYIEFQIPINSVSIRFHKTAVREHDGFFYFSIYPDILYQETALRAFQNYFTDYGTEGHPEIKVILYDKDQQTLSTNIIFPGPAIETPA